MSSFVNTIGFADFKSVLESLWVVDECQSLRYLTHWTIKSFSSSLFLFMVGFSCRRGKLDIITILSFPLRDTLSIICQGNFSIIWHQVAASDLMLLCGMHLIGTLNWCALLSRYTMPYAVWRVYVCHLCVFFACFFSYRVSYDMRWIRQTICGWEGKCEPLDCDFLANLALVMRVPMMVPVSVNVWIKYSTLRQRQNGHYIADEIVKLSSNILIPLRYIPDCPVDKEHCSGNRLMLNRQGVHLVKDRKSSHYIVEHFVCSQIICYVSLHHVTEPLAFLAATEQRWFSLPEHIHFSDVTWASLHLK